MINFTGFSGTITMIEELVGDIKGCNKMMTIDNGYGSIVRFVVSPTTYFVNHEEVAIGDIVTGYYDSNAPTILIYPPQYPALIMVKERINQNVKVAYFNNNLISSDKHLKLNISPDTKILLTNDQPFLGNPSNKNLIVIYGPTTKSIPAQTTPIKIIVWCDHNK